MKVRLKGVFGFPIQVVVLFDQSFKLFLNLNKLIVGKFVVVQLDLSMNKMFKVSLLFWQQKQEGLSCAIVASAGSTNSVNVLLDVERRVKLHNPINLWNIETSSCYVSAQKNTFLELTELVESC